MAFSLKICRPKVLKKCRFLRTSTVFLRFLALQRTPANIRINLHCQKLDSLLNICAADSVGLFTPYYSLHAKMTQLSSKATISQAQAAQHISVKQNLTQNGYSGSGDLFSDQWKADEDSISLYNNVGLITKVSKVLASESIGNRRFRHPTLV